MIKKIEKLKQMTLDKGADFGDCISYFLDMTEDRQFLAEGERLSSDPEFYRAILQPVAEFFHAEIDADSFFLIKVKPHDLVHGTVRLSNHQLVMFYYFEDIKSGIAGSGKLGEESHFFRITIKSTIVNPSRALH